MKFWRSVLFIGISYAVGRLIYDGICSAVGHKGEAEPAIISVKKIYNNNVNEEEKEENK